MLIDCIGGESKFAINAEQIGFDGRLVKCGKCGKEWFQESKLDVVEKKLVDLDQSLHAKELRVINKRNDFSDKISSLEKSLEAKKKELENQKILEQRLTLFESRIKNNDSELYRQKKYNERIGTLEKQLEKTTLDLFIKNTSLEKRCATLQELLSEKSLSDRLSSLEDVVIPKKVGGRIINTKKPIEVFDKVEDQQSFNISEGKAQPFEIDEIRKIANEDSTQTTKEKIKEKSYTHTQIHEDAEDTARIGRSGDPLKIKKI